jgi:hypothetical protein
MVAVTISAPDAPYIGKGRWMMPQFLLHDKDFMEYAVDEACKLEDSMSEPRSELSNAQTQFKDYKDRIIGFAKVRAKISVGATEKKKCKPQDERDALKNEPTGVDSDQGTSQNVPTQTTEPTEPGAGLKSPEEIARLVAALQKQINELVDRQTDRKKLETWVRGYT